jgi:transposase
MSDVREAELLELRKVVEEQRRRLEEKDREINLLRQKLDALARRIFGKSSEKLDKNQLELLLKLQGEEDLTPGKSQASSGCGDEEADLQQPGKKKRRISRKERWPKDLPVVVQVIDPVEVTAEPAAWRRIGEEVSEQLDYEPARFFRRQLIRPKYVKRGEVDAVPLIAPLPPVLQERCIAAPGLLAQIVVAKFADHLPLYRQEGIFNMRHRVQIPRQSMVRWLGMVADWLRPIYEIIRTGVMGGGYVQIDETPVRYLEPGHGQAKLGYLWTACRPAHKSRDVFYHWETGRSAACLERIVPADFHGTLQSDAYAAYQSFARTRAAAGGDGGGAIVLAGCWAHARRGFYEAKDQAPKQAAFILRQIGRLFKIEEELSKPNAGPALRQARRASESAPIYRRLHKVLVHLKGSGRYVPRTAFAKAIDYALANWESLGVYLEDGRVELSNNPVENAIRPAALGRKNFLFFGTADSGERGAILYTIIENCRRHGIDPYAYLRDVLTQLPSMTNWQLKNVTPAAWAREQQQGRLQKVA